LNLLRSLEFCAHDGAQRRAYSQHRQEKIWLVFTTRDLRSGAVVLIRVLELAQKSPFECPNRPSWVNAWPRHEELSRSRCRALQHRRAVDQTRPVPSEAIDNSLRRAGPRRKKPSQDKRAQSCSQSRAPPAYAQKPGKKARQIRPAARNLCPIHRHKRLVIHRIY
jgi:hypothetical protein